MTFWYALVPVCIQCLALPLVEPPPGILTTEKIEAGQAPEPLLQKPKGDPRQYQHSVLENGLRVVNIVDPNTTQAAVAVAVTVGSFSDPEGFDGLAHLLEHSMFLGSQNFPERSGFDAWLAQNGGSSNAYTAEEQTVFYASVSGKALAGAMQRYADIFSQPTFNASWVWDEVQAVDSEHNKNRKSQEWRVESLINLMAAKKPMIRFHTGNVQTLRSTNENTLAAKIKEFFAQHYCPPRMRLVTFGAPSLEWQLEQAQATFGQIPRQGQGCGEAAPSFQGVVPYPSSSLQQLLRMQGLTPKPELHMVFPMRTLRPWIRSNPMVYLQHILTFAGKDSLLLALRDQLNVASSLSVNREDSSAGSKIVVSLSLLPEGVERLPAVLDAFFSFIARARSGTSNAKLEVLQSLAESAQVGYDWSSLQDASRAAFEVADEMTKLGASDLLVADNLILEPDVVKVDYILNRLRPEHMLLVLVDTEQSSYWQGGQPDARSLHFYDVNYTMRPLESTWKNWKQWQLSSDAVDPFKSTTSLDERVAEVKSQFSLAVPSVIAGLPENLTQAAAPVKGSGQLGELWGDLPKRMELKAFANLDLEGAEKRDLDLWHRENWMLRHPRVTARLTLRRPQSAKGYSAKNVVDAEIGLRILNELMSAGLANLTDLGTTWKIETGNSQTFTVLLSSFAVNAKEHFAQVLTELMQEDEKAAAAERRLVRLRRELKMELEDQSEAILSVAVRERNVLLMPETFARHELLSALVEGAAETTQEALDVLEARRLGNLSMTGLVMGSCSMQLAEELQDKMLTQLGVGGGKVDLIDANSSERVDRVVRYSHPVELRGRNPRNDSSHAMLMTIMVGPSSIKKRVLLGLISEVLNEVAFKVLRTELQLGYVAGGSVSAISNILTVSCFVQSEVALPDVAEEQCEKVLAIHVVDALEKLSEAEFANIKESLRLQLLQPPLSLGEETEHFWAPILLGRCFNTSAEMLTYLKQAEKSDVLAAWKSVVMPEKVREKVAVKLFAAGHDPATREETKVELPQGLKEQLQAERKVTVTLQGLASAQKRRKLIEDGASFYPQTLKCSLAEGDAPEAVEDVLPSLGLIRREPR